MLYLSDRRSVDPLIRQTACNAQAKKCRNAHFVGQCVELGGRRVVGVEKLEGPPDRDEIANLQPRVTC